MFTNDKNQAVRLDKKNLILWSIIIVVAIVLVIGLTDDMRGSLIFKYRYHIPIILGILYGCLTGVGDAFARAKRVSMCMIIAMIVASPIFLLT